MAALFSDSTGKQGLGQSVAVKLDHDTSLAFINFKTFNDEFALQTAAGVFGTVSNVNRPLALIQSVSMRHATNHQFILSLRQTIYLYVYGNQMGDVTVTGLLFSGACDESYSGFDSVLQFYTENRLSTRKEPIEVKVGRTVFQGFMTGLTIEPTDNIMLVTPFTLTLKLLPIDNVHAPNWGQRLYDWW